MSCRGVPSDVQKARQPGRTKDPAKTGGPALPQPVARALPGKKIFKNGSEDLNERFFSAPLERALIMARLWQSPEHTSL